MDSLKSSRDQQKYEQKFPVVSSFEDIDYSRSEMLSQMY